MNKMQNIIKTIMNNLPFTSRRFIWQPVVKIEVYGRRFDTIFEIYEPEGHGEVMGMVEGMDTVEVVISYSVKATFDKPIIIINEQPSHLVASNDFWEG